MITIERTQPSIHSLQSFVALVVDHDPASRLNLCGLIESEGGKGIEAKNSTGALLAFIERRPDVVLLDTTNPETDGFDICKQIQALPHGADTPVLMIIASDHADAVTQALAVGAADYVTRPIHPVVLRQRMRRLMQVHTIDTAILRAKKEWEAAADAVSDMVILTDVDGKIIRCNLATIQRLQTTYLQLIGRDLASVLLLGTGYELDLPFGGTREMQFTALSGWFEVSAFSGQVGDCKYTIVYVLKDITKRKQLEADIQQRERRFKALVENISEGVELFDAEGKVIYASPMVSRILGRPEGTDLVGPNPMDHLHPEDIKHGFPLFLQMLQNPGCIFTFEMRTQHADGSWIWAEATARNMLAEPGIDAVLLNFRDITPRKQLEEALRQSELRFRALTENISEGIVLYDINGNILYLSQAVTHITGYGQEIVGENAFAFGHPDDVPYVQEDFARLIEHPEESVTAQARMKHKNGSWIWIESTGRNMLAEPGINAILVNFKDITVRKQEELKFRQLSQAVEQSPVSIMITNIAGDIEYVNPRFTQLTGYSFKEVVGQNPRLLKSDQTPSETFAQLWSALRSGREWHGEFINRKKNSEIFIERASISPVVDEKGAVTHFLALKEDITERKQLEESLGQSEKRFRAMIENSADAIALVNVKGIITFATPAISNISGYPLDNYVGHSAFEFIHPDDLPELMNGFTELVRTPGSVSTSLFRFQHIDGSWRWVAVTTSNQLTDPAVRALIVNFRDVTENKRAEDMLKQTEERLRLIVETVPIPILISSTAEGTILFANTALSELLGVPVQELLGRQTPDFYCDPSDRQLLLEALKREGKLHNYELALKNFDQTPIWVLVSMQPLMFADQPALLAALYDVTERKQAEEALRLSEERFQLVTHATNDTVWDLNLSTREIWWNRGISSQFGYARDQIGTNEDWWRAHIHPDDRSKVVASFQAALTGDGQFWSKEYRFRRADGNYASVFDRGYIIQDEHGQPQRVIGAMMDLSERKRVEEALVKSEELFSKAFHNSPAPMAITRINDGIIIDVNGSWEHMIGYSRQEIVGHPILDLDLFIDPHDRAAIIQQINEQGKIIDYELKVRTKSEDELNLLMSAQKVELQGQDCLLSTFYNITELRRMHEAMLASQKLADLGTLAAGVAHEMNSPLQVITGLSQSLLKRLATSDGVAPEQLQRSLEVVQRNGWRCAEIVRSLHTYARNSGGSMEPAQLNEVVCDGLLLIEHQLNSWANISVQNALAEALPSLICDRNQITQVLINLLTNARDAMPEGGEIRVVTDYDPKSDQLILQVSDTGVGIPDSIRSKIFDPFFTTKPLGKGTGLGLSIVAGIVRAHGGSITVSSAFPQGTTFTILFPTKRPKLPDSDTTTTPGRFDDIGNTGLPTAEQISFVKEHLS